MAPEDSRPGGHGQAPAPDGCAGAGEWSVDRSGRGESGAGEGRETASPKREAPGSLESQATPIAVSSSTGQLKSYVGQVRERSHTHSGYAMSCVYGTQRQVR